MRQTQHIIIDRHIDTEKFKVGLHVAIQTTNFRRQMNNMSRLMLFKYLNAE